MARSRQWLVIVSSEPEIGPSKKKHAYFQRTHTLVAMRAKDHAEMCRLRAKQLHTPSAKLLTGIHVALNSHFTATPIKNSADDDNVFVVSHVISANFSDFVDRRAAERILLTDQDQCDPHTCLNLVACDAYYPCPSLSVDF